MNHDEKQVPLHVGIILDGNRRWAKKRGLPIFEGHRKGYEKLKQAPRWFFSRGVKILSVFAFSTENWDRSQKEVNYLMRLLKGALIKETKRAQKEGYRVLISGRIDELPEDLPTLCRETIEKTKPNQNGIFNICLNYGGRAEIIDAVQKIIKNNKDGKEDDISEETIKKYLYQSELPDLDIIVRTSGEKRTSGFLLWQASYSEFLFIEKHWPDFEESDVEYILDEYSKRKRRFGGN